jgi:hypothetical protein
MTKEFEIELHPPVPGGADIPADGFGWPVWPLTFWSPNGQGNAAKVKLLGRGQDEHIYLADEQMRLGFLLTPDQARQWALSLNAAADLVDSGWFKKWRRGSAHG